MPEQQLLIATNNRQKFRELAMVFAAHGVTVLPYWTVIERQQFPTEGTSDFKDNAEQKALFIQQQVPNAIVIADDSGLLVQALPDHFGLTTMRELKAHAKTDAEMNQYILQLLAATQTTNRHAKLTTTLTAALPNETTCVATGQTTFTVAQQPLGHYSVGFDRIMWLPEVGLTLAQLPDVARLSFLPRNQAVTALLRRLRKDGVLL
ncbi:non-canonical purine NTP pyrophosphatase [Furfurilactobacillus siliginis]|uniref:Non-canonical purine NTP pyrophosphatase n=1 Tax=Furfurilactobacillus siliginis TaxID=348151 RepID=A0A0R2KYT6_9LACO|nr:non-canonical purine NTP pyrophosphatase [Furfurilactobacillus siliginis]KRN94691.1 hypothetical protein IV55_GL000459 [Furfurilactobacillus siliginis]GEK28403.1 non-canonical purine NTP pyrophosphatase [Furfurilactobacillus siliginis]